MAIFDTYTHCTSLSAALFPLLLERARERRFKKPTLMSTPYISPICTIFSWFNAILMPVFNNDNLLRVNHLSAGYGKRQVLYDVSFAVKRGEIVLFIGGNGSGKSTLLKAIYGLVPKWHNPNERLSCESVQFVSEDITHTKPYELIQKGLVYVPQKNNTFDQLSVSENLEVAATHLRDQTELKKRMNAVFEKLPQLATLKS
jgi:ABC-type lipopolysaccharide export system ATPase subunit